MDKIQPLFIHLYHGGVFCWLYCWSLLVPGQPLYRFLLFLGMRVEWSMQQWRTCHSPVHRLHLCQLLLPPSAGCCWFPSPSSSTPWKHCTDKQGRKPRALHDVALCGPTTIFNNCQPCLGNGGLAWRRFCLLFCWAACNVQNRTPLEPRAAPTVSAYFCFKGCKPFPPSLYTLWIFGGLKLLRKSNLFGEGWEELKNPYISKGG